MAYAMSRRPEKPRSSDSRVQRVRETQRRCRARQREYIRDLQQRVERCELEGIQISYELQREAKRIAQENVRLRELARRLGISAREIATAVERIDDDGDGVPPPPPPMQPLYGPSQAYLDLMTALEPRPVIIPSWPPVEVSVEAPSPTTGLPSPELQSFGLQDPLLQPEVPEANGPYENTSLFVVGDYAHPDISSQVPPNFSGTPMLGIETNQYVGPAVLMPLIANPQHVESAVSMPYLSVYGQPVPSFPMAPIGLNLYLVPETLFLPVQATQAYQPQQHQLVDFEMLPAGRRESPNRSAWDMSVMHQYPPHL